MTVDTIHSDIFGLSGRDDNNDYIHLYGDRLNSVQLVEPALTVEQFQLKPNDLHEEYNLPDKYAYRIPLIAIDNYLINQIDICLFKLDYTGFLPMLTFEFVDSSNRILSTDVPKDGSLIKVYIGGQGDEMYYKPIRQDFVLTSIRKVAGGQQNRGDLFRYRVYGKLNVPYGYRKESWCAGKTTAMQALFNLSIWTGLGFATNFTKTSSCDKMKWTNMETGTYFDFMQDITSHACYSPNTFFTSFIDQYYVLNFVECHSLLSHGGSKSDVPAMRYKCFPPPQLPNYNPDKDNKTTDNQIPINDRDKETEQYFDRLNTQQQLDCYYITNNENYTGWSNFIEEYHEISNGASSLSDGMVTHVRYTDSNRTDNIKFDNYEFTIRPIDNLKRTSEDQKIIPLDDEPTQESYIPLNLIKTTKGNLDNLSSIDNMSNVESFTNFGNVDTSNTFRAYYFAEVQNSFQLKCLKKCGLSVKLQNYNPAITKFSRIWVDIFDKNFHSPVKELEKHENDSEIYGEYKEENNKNLLYFKGEGLDEMHKDDMWGTFNRALSGWYVVTGIEIEYDPKDNNLKMNLTLNRIEYKPCFKSEYKCAKEAIDKYREENTIDNFFKESV